MGRLLSERMIAELDELTVDEVFEGMLAYVARRHRVLASGQRKLTVIFERGEVRRHFLEIRGGRFEARRPV